MPTNHPIQLISGAILCLAMVFMVGNMTNESLPSDEILVS
jgi:hypothetical protein